MDEDTFTFPDSIPTNEEFDEIPDISLYNDKDQLDQFYDQLESVEDETDDSISEETESRGGMSQSSAQTLKPTFTKARYEIVSARALEFS